MAKAFDLRKQLKLHDKQLLRRLFCDLPEMATVHWDTLRPNQVEPIDEENNLTAREDSHAFNNVFVYHPSQGAVELIAERSQKVQ